MKSPAYAVIEEEHEARDILSEVRVAHHDELGATTALDWLRANGCPLRRST